MADARDLKSRDHKKSCGFESHHRHQFSHTQLETIMASARVPRSDHAMVRIKLVRTSR